MRDLLISGAMKAGTTSLYHYLASHPAIAPSYVKETHYYAADLREHFAPRVVTESDVVAAHEAEPTEWFHHARIKSKVTYDSLFPVSDARQIRMEASPSYLPSQAASGRIAVEAVNPIVVVILRDPFERIVSHYEMNKGHGITSNSLDAVLREEVAQGLPLVRDGQVALTRLSLYADDLRRMIEAVGRAQVYVLTMEQLKYEMERVLGSICDRLSLPFSADLLGEERQHNRTLEPRMPWVNRTLTQTGILQIAKRTVPVSVKRQLINFYYKQRKREPGQYEGALRLVQPLIINDLERLSNLLEADYTGWTLK